jgi:amino acid adenylation domain-containing protein
LAVLLKKLGAGEDIGIGTVVAGRSERELEELVGFFVNTLVLRTDVAGDPSFVELIERVRKFDLEAYGKEELPFERLVEALQPVRSQARHPLVQVMLTLQNTPHAALRFPGLSTRTEVVEFKSAKFDLGIGLEEILDADGDALGLEGEIEFNQDIFNTATIASIASRLVALLSQTVNEPHKLLHELEIISAAEKRFLIEECNKTSELGLDAEVVEMFERQVACTPGATAVIQGENALTYHELNRQANRLAHYLIQLKVRPESLVGIALDRSPLMVLAILAVWKAGAAYVPFDPEYPQVRLEYMLSETLPEIILSTSDLIPRLPKTQGVHFIELDSQEIRNKLDRAPEGNPIGRLFPANAAYVIYTSGSTGNPKGVVVSHAGVASLARTHLSRLNLTESSRVLQFASLNFDQSFWELLMALTSGAALVLPEGERSGVPLQQLISQQKVTHATLTPSVLATIQDPQRSLDNLIVVGEKCPPELVARWAPLCRMINAYGPTESTVCAAISRPISEFVSPPIGFPVVNTRLYVLDDYLEPVPVGVLGELYIASVGLARGYLKQPGLTSARFIADPYVSARGSRMYRTGDLVRRQADGNLEFIGRTDDQVKVRGFRIELGEIEAALRSLAGVADCTVVIRESRLGKEIVAHVVAKDQSCVDRDEIRRHLRAHLPGQMIPAEIVLLEQLPLTHSGKVNRKALSNRQPDVWEFQQLVLPRTKYERLAADIWKQVLGREAVGVDDNFFDVGGHSLLLAQVHARLLKVLDKPLPMVKLFEHPTISLLASYLEGLDAASSTQGIFQSIGFNPRKSRDIAIIGMACRFPGAGSVEQFWQNLSQGIDSITEVSQEELSTWPRDFVADPGFVNAGGYLDNIELFDAAFFGLNPAEATAMDPQQRLLLECAWEAMETAGYVSRGQRIGVFAGAGESHYRDLLRRDESLARTLGELQVTIATGKDHIAPRVSYLLDLRGPSVPVNTACSTSLVAVHMACQSLMNGECEMALAGGVSLAPRSGYLYEENSILSPDGRCKAFDVEARGTVPGSGAGLVLLKPLDAALADGDYVHAVIKGSAINNDGTVKVGYTAPSVEGQRRVIVDALSRAGVDPQQISYIEAHGTGTSLGDPIEIEALRQALSASGATGSLEKSCAIGSVKANIGHCDSAAGIAGLIKTVLCLEHRTLVPSLHFHKPNPQLDLEHSPFYVNTQTKTWEADHRFAGVSSFGIGGTNAHVILQEAFAPLPSPAARRWKLLTLSARSEATLERRKKELVKVFSAKPEISLADAAFTLNAGRETFAVRQSFVCSSNEEAIAALVNKREPHRHTDSREHSLVFMFSGQGKAYQDLGADLYSSEVLFRDTVNHCSETLRPLIGTDLRELMFTSEGKVDSQIYRPLFWQPALFVIDYALAQLWMSWGIRPTAMIGHSLGEYVAATVAGVLRLEDALKLVAERASGTEKLEPGAMLAIPVSEAQILPYIKDRVALAAVNGPELCLLAGPVEEIDALQREIHSLNPIRLEASHAFHSVLVEPIMEPLARAAATVELRAPKIPYLSNVTGTWMTEADATAPNYWARHLRSAVRFEESVKAALTLENAVLLEIGPGKVLTDLVRRTHTQATVISSLGTDSPCKALAQSLGKLWCQGIKIDWNEYYSGQRRQRVPLPTYPFERQRYWVNATATIVPVTVADPLSAKDPFEKWFYSTNWKRTNHLPNWNPQPTGEKRSWLLFSDGQGISAQIADKLRERNCIVHEVRRGNVFHRNGTGHGTVNPSNAQDFQRLVESFSSSFPKHIMWAWNSRGNSQNGTNSSFDGLIYLAQALASSTNSASVRLAVISSGLYRLLDEPLSLDEDASSLGIVHVLPKEIPFIKCQNVDVYLERGQNDLDLAEHILAELTAEIIEPVVAYRAARRWLPIVEQMAPSADIKMPLRRDGVYVITHALQEIGFSLAEYLTGALGCRVAMVDRSFFPRTHEWEQWVQMQGEADPISRYIIRLRSMPDAPSIFSANFSEAGQVARLKRQIEAEMGEIQGVFHLDRAARTGLIIGKTASPSAAVRNDLAELAMLEANFPDQSLVLFSSNLAECGGIGQIDQAARSSVIAHFAERRSATGRQTLAVELGTRSWAELQAESPDASSFLSQQLEEKRQRFGMTQQECLKVILHAIAIGLPNVIVSTRDFNALMAQQHLFTADFFQEQMEQADAIGKANAQAGHGRPDVSSAYVPPRNEVEKLLVQIWKEAFRCDQIGVDDNFFELGGHSLMAVQLLKSINQTFSAKTALKDLFENPTIAQLGGRLSGTQVQDSESNELEALLAEIESMSEDELRAELGGKAKD